MRFWCWIESDLCAAFFYFGFSIIKAETIFKVVNKTIHCSSDFIGVSARSPQGAGISTQVLFIIKTGYSFTRRCSTGSITVARENHAFN